MTKSRLPTCYKIVGENMARFSLHIEYNNDQNCYTDHKQFEIEADDVGSAYTKFRNDNNYSAWPEDINSLNEGEYDEDNTYELHENRHYVTIHGDQGQWICTIKELTKALPFAAAMKEVVSNLDGIPKANIHDKESFVQTDENEFSFKFRRGCMIDEKQAECNVSINREFNRVSISVYMRDVLNNSNINPDKAHLVEEIVRKYNDIASQLKEDLKEIIKA